MNKLKLLIVEDERETFEVYKSLLASKFEIHFSRTVLQAQKEIQEWEPLVVLTDLRLPGESGEKLLKFLERYPEIARLVVTGYPTDFVREFGGDIVVDRLLEKPIEDEKILIDAISESIVCACSRLTRKSDV